MLQVQVDEDEVRQLYEKAIDSKLKQMDKELIWWDSTELKRRTCMCWNTIQDNFFFDEAFPKYKVGGKWYFPAKETVSFLENWIKNRK